MSDPASTAEKKPRPAFGKTGGKQGGKSVEKKEGAAFGPTGGKAGAKSGAPAGLHRAGHDPRAAALLVLLRVVFEGKDSQAALDDALRSPLLVPSDKSLCTEIVYGTLRRYLRLEWFARRFLAKPEKLPPELFLCLLSTLYEMAFLRTPHHAGVNWAVSHARNRFGPGMARVANGALRSMQRALAEFHSPALYLGGEADAVESVEAESLARLHAVPLWLARLWLRQYGRREAQALLEASCLPAPAGVRVNMGGLGAPEKAWRLLFEELKNAPAENAGTLRPDPSRPGKAASRPAKGPGSGEEPADPPADRLAAGKSEDGAFAAEKDPGEDAPGVILAGGCALAFPGGLPWQARKAVAEGRASRQSAASYAALLSLDPLSWPGPLWDCCAGRGGKALALLEMGVPVALATDPARRRLEAIDAEYARLGLSSPPCPQTLAVSAARAGGDVADGTCPPPGETPRNGCLLEDAVPAGGFGAVLVDAPCSGLGTLARRPEIRLRRTEDDIAALAAAQREILEAVWPRLRPGGLLVYLTCTRTREENQDQVAGFLSRHPDAALEREYETPASSPLREFFYGARIRKG